MSYAQGIVDIFVDALLKIRDDNDRDNSFIRISGSGDPECKIYNRMTNAHCIPSTAHQMYTFQTGHAMHAAWQKISHDCGLTCAEPYLEEDGSVGFRGLAEICVSDPDANTMGHFDLLTAPIARRNGSLAVGEGKSHFIVDFKTISNIPKISVLRSARKPIYDENGVAYFNYWKNVPLSDPLSIKEMMSDERGSETLGAKTEADSKGFVSTTPMRIIPGDFTALCNMKDEHRMQATEYAYVINKYGLDKKDWPEGWPCEERGGRVFPNVGGIIIIYLAKDCRPGEYKDPSNERNCPIKAYAEGISQSVVDDLQDKYARVNDAVMSKTRPELMLDSNGGPSHFPCHYCEFRHACYPLHFDKSGAKR